MLTRRAILLGAGLLAPKLGRTQQSRDIRLELRALEQKNKTRIGLAASDTGSGKTIFYREGERFLMCSTFKLLLVAAILARVDTGAEELMRVISYSENDLLEYAPVTTKHVASGMTVAALCQAAMNWSDNTAGNLLLATIGGPDGFNRYIRGLGDRSTHLDRIEPLLNLPGGTRDTTTPAAMLADMNNVLLRDALSGDSSERLVAWMQSNTTGNAMLRAGLPTDWHIGDKTGRGQSGTVNDVAIAMPSSLREPVLIVAYTSHGSEAVLAEVGRLVADVLG